MRWDEAYIEKIIDPSHLEMKVNDFKKGGKTVATLNGSFDLLHAGHLEILFQGSQTADIFIVLLNSDESIKKYKCETRPIIPLEYRLKLIAALSFVDYVSWFNETDPRIILEKIKPHTHVNGAEYGINCLEADIVKAHGGKIHIVDLVPGLSTSQIISKICASS